MSTLRINNIEAQSVPASPTIDEKVKVTNSSGDILVNIDGKTSGITTIGINTTDGNIKFDANSNVLITGILTATTLAGNFTPDSLEIGSNIKLGNAGVITATSFVGSGANLTNLPAQATIANNGNDRIITGGSGVNLNGEANLQFDGTDLYVSDKIKHLGDPDTFMEFGTNSITFDTAGSERLRITSDGYFKLGSTDGGAWHTIRLNTTTNNAIKDVLNIHSSVDSATAAAGFGVRLNFFGEQLNGNEYIYGSIAGLLSSTGSNYGDLAFYTNNNGTNTERLRIGSDGLLTVNGNADFNVTNGELDIYSTGSGDQLSLRLLNSDTTVGNKIGIYFGPCNNVAGAYIKGVAESDFTSGANRDAGLEFGTRLNATFLAPLKISAAGYVTKPYTPRFQAYMSGSHFQISGGSNHIAYNTEVYDVGSNYNTSNGRFTAPVAGAYYFQHCLQIRKALSGTGVIEAKVWVIPAGGSASERIRDYKEVIATNIAGRAFGVLQLNAGDQVYPAYYSSINPTYVQNNGGNTPLTSFFEGYLIG